MSGSAPQPIPTDPPEALLDHVSHLRRQARARSRGAWLPLVAFALLTLASTLLYRQPFYTPPADGGDGYSVELPGSAGLPWSERSATLSIGFWLVLAPLCYLGCARWYHWRAERRGVSLRWQTWVRAGLALFGALGVVLAGRPAAWLAAPALWAATRWAAVLPWLGAEPAAGDRARPAGARPGRAQPERGRHRHPLRRAGDGDEPVRARPAPAVDAPTPRRQHRRARRRRPNMLLLAAILLLGAAMTGRRRARAARRVARPRPA